MDINLNFCQKGEGEVLILLHGNGENFSYFKEQIEYFSKKYKVIAIDTRGHGASPRGTAPFTIRQFADDLFYFMNEHKISKANILGFSDGGNIALVFALNYPEKVNKLILNGANLNGRGVKPGIQLPIVLGYCISSLFKNKSENAKKKSELLRLMVKDPNINIASLSLLDMPTLVIAGDHDMIKTSHTKAIGRSIKNSRTVIMQGDHFIASKKHLEFNRIVADFLSQ